MQMEIFGHGKIVRRSRTNGTINRMETYDRRFHDWYRFVLSFPPHLVRDYIEKFNLKVGQTLLDPFCGTGTTLIVAKAHGIKSIGIEANPMAHFASSVKTDWDIDPNDLLWLTDQITARAEQEFDGSCGDNLLRLPEESMSLLLRDSISPLPLHKSLVLLKAIREFQESRCLRHLLLGFAKSAVLYASNLYFGPEVGVKSVKRRDSSIIRNWQKEMELISEDIHFAGSGGPKSVIFLGDSRKISDYVAPCSIDAVFTSPPYPNEKDYTRTTRLESVILQFINSRDELRKLKDGILRSNTRNVYKDDADDIFVANNAKIQQVSNDIERRRIELGKSSGFERQYARVTKLYFGGMARHLMDLRKCLKPGALLGYVVGDQASYLQVMIKTGELLAEIAESLGYHIQDIELFRTRFATATKKQLREEIVILEWPGEHKILAKEGSNV